MTFLADEFLEYYVSKKTKGSLYGVISCVFLFVILGFAFYYKSSSTTTYYLNMVVVLLISCAGMYSLTTMEGGKLNKLVEKIIFINNEFILTTYSYRCLFYVIKPLTFEIAKNDIVIQEVDFPFNSLGLDKNKTYCVSVMENKIYICYEHFPDELLQGLVVK
jgi:hypothetical protein